MHPNRKALQTRSVNLQDTPRGEYKGLVETSDTLTRSTYGEAYFKENTKTHLYVVILKIILQLLNLTSNHEIHYNFRDR